MWSFEFLLSTAVVQWCSLFQFSNWRALVRPKQVSLSRCFYFCLEGTNSYWKITSCTNQSDSVEFPHDTPMPFLPDLATASPKLKCIMFGGTTECFQISCVQSCEIWEPFPKLTFLFLNLLCTVECVQAAKCMGVFGGSSGCGDALPKILDPCVQDHTRNAETDVDAEASTQPALSLSETDGALPRRTMVLYCLWWFYQSIDGFIGCCKSMWLIGFTLCSTRRWQIQQTALFVKFTR